MSTSEKAVAWVLGGPAAERTLLPLARLLCSGVAAAHVRWLLEACCAAPAWQKTIQPVKCAALA